MLIFLDDTSLLSRRAEELTLSSLGRLSASIAHEIRNPLAAISYSAQLLAESPKLEPERQAPGRDHQQPLHARERRSSRTSCSSRGANARGRRASTSTRGCSHFVEDYKQSNDLGDDQLRAVTQNRRIEAMVDPQHLQQVAWNLVQNALRYGRLPNEPARVTVAARLATDKGPPMIEVIDRGPGIPPKVAGQIFEPFFTTHEYGTGLGLYLARQMSRGEPGDARIRPGRGRRQLLPHHVDAALARCSRPGSPHNRPDARREMHAPCHTLRWRTPRFNLAAANP